MFWFLRGLVRGVVTTRYPRRIDAWAATLPTPPAFRSDLLTEELADRLIEICPSEALRRAGGSLILDLGACTACGRCGQEGGEAVQPSGVFELAALSPAQLVKRIPIRRSADERP